MSVATTAAAAAAQDDGTLDDHVISTINQLIDEKKVVNVVEDPRNTFIRSSSEPQAVPAAKWMANKMQEGQKGGAEVLKRYIKLNQKEGNAPKPTGLGTAGLARAEKFTKPGDETPYFLYGDAEIDAFKATKNPPATTPSHKAISQAMAYVTLYRNDFFVGKDLTRLIRRGDVNASQKGNLACVSIQPGPGANALPGGGTAPMCVGKGTKVEQVVDGKTVTGVLWKSVEVGAGEIWVELQDCKDLVTGLILNGGSMGDKIRFKTSTGTIDHMITVGDSAPGAASFVAKVTGIDVYVMVVEDDVDPRLSPFMAIPAGCNPFHALSDDLRKAIHYLACLDAAHSRVNTVASDDTGDEFDLDDVSLTIALPDHKLTVKCFDYTRSKQHFAQGAKFPNLQCDVKIFEGVSVNRDVVSTIKDAYAKCFIEKASPSADGFLPVLANRKMKQQKQMAAGQVARDALCSISPTAKMVLSLRAAKNTTCPKRLREVEDALGLIAKQTKKTKTGTGGKRSVDEVPYHVLWYAVQDMLLLGDWTADQLRKLLRRAAKARGTVYGNTLKVKDAFDGSDNVARLSLGLQLAWFKRPLNDTVRCDTEVFESSEEDYTLEELEL